MPMCRQKGGVGLSVVPYGCRVVSFLCSGREAYMKAVLGGPILPPPRPELEDVLTVIVEDRFF